jgi:hypothetical protein
LPLKTTDWDQIDRLRSALRVPRLRIDHREDSEVKLLSYDFNDKKRFPKPLPCVELIHITDMQVGSKGFLRDKFLRYRDWVLSVPQRFVLLGGDIVDAATLLSVGSPYDNTGEPIEQVDDAVEILEPLATAGRLLAYVGGNHERRTIKTFGDCGRLIARSLHVPYSRGVQLIDIHYGEHAPFKVSLWHGGGSAQTKGAKAQMLHRFMGKGDSQLYLVGHLHDALVIPDWRQQRHGGKIRLQKIMGVMSSSFLAYWNSYAEVAALTPSDTMMARAILYPDGAWECTLR